MDAASDPAGFVVESDTGDRIHFLDWGGTGEPAVLLVHGLSNTAWTWAPVARRLAVERHVVAMDLRGHGLSDSPTEAYTADILAADVAAVAEGAGLLATGPIVVAGHGFGGIVAALGAARLAQRCARLVLVDGGWEDAELSTGLDIDEFSRGLDEPPEVLASMRAYLADRAGWDPSTWDADQEKAARATVVETAAGRVVPATRPHALAASVAAMFAYRPEETLPAVTAPIVALAATTTPPADGIAPIEVRRVQAIGHNLPRYAPDAVTAAILGR